jgi:glycine betaine/proline transport system ATP-binding protein
MAAEHANTNKLAVSHLTTVFGENRRDALYLMEQGHSREEIMQRTGATVALRDISFSVAAGEIFVIMGLSGSGKSTLLRCLNRLIESTRGSITVDGQEVTQFSNDELTRYRRESLGMVFQNFALFPNRSVARNVAFGLEIQGTDATTRERRVNDVLEVVGLTKWADAPVSSLSGGMQQRVGLARALAIDPEILLMDEPFSALDPLIRTQMQDELLRLERELQKTIIFITHDLNEAIKVGDRIAIINSEGQLVQIGTPEEILLSPADAYVERFIGDVDRPAVVRVESVMVSPSQKRHEKPAHAAAPHDTIKDVLYDVMTATEPVPVFDGDTHVGDVSNERVQAILKRERHSEQAAA